MKIEVNSERWLDLKPFPGEVWAKIDSDPAYGEHYVSNYGRVKRMPFFGGRYHFPEMIFKVHLSKKDGYYKVRVAGKMKYVHRLVANAFISNPFNKKYVDHRNCDKLDNRARNLRWVTAKENANNPITKWRRDFRFGMQSGEEPSAERTQISLEKVGLRKKRVG